MKHITATLNNLGIIISLNNLKINLTNKELTKLQNKYTLSVKNELNNYITKIKMYSIFSNNNEQFIVFPKFSLLYLLEKKYINDVNNVLSNGKNINMHYIGKSNSNQVLIVDHILNNIYNKNNFINGVTLKLATGQGKTFNAMDIISKINKKTLIIVPTSYLLQQWVNLLEQYFPNNTIGTFYSKAKKDGDIIVAVINSVALLDEFKVNERIISVNKLFSKCGLVIFDESHLYISKMFKKVFYRLNCKYILGLSATPDQRLYNQDDIHLLNIGPILDASTIPNIKLDEHSFISDVNVIKYNGPDQYTKIILNNNGIIDYNAILNMFIDDMYRNQLIVNNIKNLLNQSLCIFVFTDRRKHAELLYNILLNQTDDNDIFNASVPELNLQKPIILYGGSKDNEIKEAKEVSNVIFTTYAYSSTGVSINKMNALILASPRKSNMTQIIGRIFRLGSDQAKKRIIIDIVDNKSFVKKQFYQKRRHAYIKQGCEFIETTINYEDIDVEYAL